MRSIIYKTSLLKIGIMHSCQHIIHCRFNSLKI